MTIKELLANTYKSNFNWMEELEVKHYIPIMDKKMFVMDVIAECTDDVDDFITVDRFKMNIYFDMKALATYTNLKIADDFDDMISQYDMLCENGTMDLIISLFKNDYDSMHVVLDDALDELLVQNSIDAQVVRIANRINNVIDTISDKIDSVDFNAILPEGMDINQLINMVNKLK